jgi:ABC-type uncharacterized transport system ATPase subunit
MADPIIEMSGVWKIFGAAEQVALADAKSGASKDDILKRHKCVVGIADASISVLKGEIFCIMGLSGSGKSTLLRHVNRLIEPTAGDIRILGQDVRALSPKALRQLRAERITKSHAMARISGKTGFGWPAGILRPVATGFVRRHAATRRAGARPCRRSGDLADERAIFGA